MDESIEESFSARMDGESGIYVFMKNCIACAESIQEAAILCRYCSTRQDDKGFLSYGASKERPAPKVSKLDHRSSSIAWAAHLIDNGHSDETPHQQSTLCQEVDVVVEVLEMALGESQTGLKYSVSLRAREGLFYKALGSAKDRGQNLHIRSLMGLTTTYFCDGRFWQSDTYGAHLTTWDRMETLKFVPHGRPLETAAMIVAAEISYAKLLLKRPDEGDSEKDLNLVAQSIEELETALIVFQFAYPVITEALRHDAYQNSIMNTTWRGDQKRYKPFPWP